MARPSGGESSGHNQPSGGYSQPSHRHPAAMHRVRAVELMDDEIPF